MYLDIIRGVHGFQNGRTENRTDPIRFGSVCIFQIFEFFDPNQTEIWFGSVRFYIKKYKLTEITEITDYLFIYCLLFLYF